MMTDKAYDVILNTLTPETTRDDVTLPDLDRKPDPWESSMQATAECLSWRGAWDNLDRRHTEDQLGETVYRDFPVRSRSVVATAHALMDKGVIGPDELQAKMEEVRARFNRQ
ncbi:SH3-like domain-containing protein [Rhodococcus opacus]|uniref:SH3-like domain-containing protein n=1 Tax=Rhodococcus opacus TaxID=37919 RepID=UPI00030E15EA|nr:SH3-like domain-containing protein [Rhodococcus opacus]AHK28114.1 Thiocyanate hydrolase subunit beta [Rhodococcus opacus PD630]UDG98030.1 nitrile hydratase subunit beta [Rhodococcus opacus PD630]